MNVQRVMNTLSARRMMFLRCRVDSRLLAAMLYASVSCMFLIPALAGVAMPPTGKQCLTSTGAALVAQQRLNGSISRLTGQFESRLSISSLEHLLHSRLLELAAPGHLMRSQANPWTVFSYWLDDVLCIVQIRANGVGSRGLVSATRYGPSAGGGTTSVALRAPGWWPAVPGQRLYEWRDAAAVVTTVVATMREPAGLVAQRLSQSAALAGLSATARHVAKPAGPMRGSVLVLEGNSERASITLFPVPGGTGVVAHIQRSSSR